ncbi:Terpenoid cyclases/Protein prenyltransferase [Mycena venus]|uniref:Terpenoid cyclases/Protein prenyltransferase n=1 Tax=Mycena venus TaxID=2733690 RepID=A0A8H7DB54_9AGAR|nr:Terpenoid cyclases/Protein prenyltransferase [Mycena venus]
MNRFSEPLPSLARPAHISHAKHALARLPGSLVDLDASRMAIVFYCIGTLDLLGVLQDQTSETERASWRNWIWEQYAIGRYGTGFKPGPFMSTTSTNSGHDSPHIIMTYTALLSLSMLRDDFSRLNRPGLLRFVSSCQNRDGSFSNTPNGGGDSDLRNLYSAFCICSMLGDWSSIDVECAIAFVASCRTYEGGYGQLPSCEAQGGTTYLALAALHLAPPGPRPRLSTAEKAKSEHWLVHNQDPASGGFRGRTGKAPDVCYCFWGGAALRILGAHDKINAYAFTQFIAACQFPFGGIAKAPGQPPDVYHTYLSLAAAAMYAPRLELSARAYGQWEFGPFNPLLNAREETVRWARSHIPARRF